MRSLVALGVLLALAPCAPVLAAPAESGMYSAPAGGALRGTSPGGTAYVVERLAGPPVAVVSLWFRAPATGFGPKPLPSLSRTAAEVVIASKPIAGKPLGSQVDEAGGRINVSVYADSVVVSAVVPAASAPSVVSAMSRAFFAPVVTDDSLAPALRVVAMETLFAQYDPETAVHDAIFGALFAQGPFHTPALGSPQALRSISINDVRAFATRAFRAQNAVLVVSGAVDGSILQALSEGRPAAPDTPASPEALVSTVPAAGAANISATFADPLEAIGYAGPPIAEQRAATALDFIADYLFRPQTGTVARELQKASPDSYVQGQFVTLHDPGVFVVWVAGKSVAEGNARVERALADMKKPLDRQAFAAAVNAFQYHMLGDIQTVQQVADNEGWYWTQGSPLYAPGSGGPEGEYMKALRSLTPEFVAQVAATYLKDGVHVSFSPAPAPSPAPSAKAVTQ